ncbi:MAG: PHP domain-containing protein [Tepidisphaeraceae bacterium]
MSSASETLLGSSYVDLHCHSTASDGTLTPLEVVRLAKSSGLSGLSLTDHDTIAGISEACSAASSLGIDFLPGIEISCKYPHPGTMHLLGYGIDPDSPALARMMRRLIVARDRRNRLMVARLNKLGIKLTLDDVRAEGNGVIGRLHMAKALVREGCVRTTREAFSHYLGRGGSAWIDKEQLTPRQAIATIHTAGGLAVLAHPVQLRAQSDSQLAAVLTDLTDSGLDGIEVIHSDHDRAMMARLEGWARRLKLLPTGGSDFHGGNKPAVRLGRAGLRRVPRAWFDALASRVAVSG